MRKIVIGLMFLACVSFAIADFGGYLKQSTARTVVIGPVNTIATGVYTDAVTFAQAEIFLSKNGGEAAQTHNAAGSSLNKWGSYNIPLDTTDTNTLGSLDLTAYDSGATTPALHATYMVVTADYYNVIFTDSTIASATDIAEAVVQLQLPPPAGGSPLTSGSLVSRTVVGNQVTAVILAVGSSASDDYYNGKQIVFNPTGVRTPTTISDYTGSTREALLWPYPMSTGVGAVGATAAYEIITPTASSGSSVDGFGPNSALAVLEKSGSGAGTTLSTTSTIYLTANTLDASLYAIGMTVLFADASGVYHYGIISNNSSDTLTLLTATAAAPADLTPIYSLGNMVSSSVWDSIVNSTSHSTQQTFGAKIGYGLGITGPKLESATSTSTARVLYLTSTDKTSEDRNFRSGVVVGFYDSDGDFHRAVVRSYVNNGTLITLSLYTNDGGVCPDQGKVYVVGNAYYDFLSSMIGIFSGR